MHGFLTLSAVITPSLENKVRPYISHPRQADHNVNTNVPQIFAMPAEKVQDRLELPPTAHRTSYG
ncbi:hypothetical protein CNECB9_1010013 [Cupriavidus necator]|uniref:Uncharacterized protein n=1 Tax=Cupriavidus necator TaxID=106590 RepID=A0A1K0JDB3_CUPNE|nr:hypothetical protein CNECB9_1010013 [Cupriavidus necator]